MIRGIHHVAVNTTNLDRLYRFYVEVIGFQPTIDEFRWKDNPAIDRIIGLRGSAARTRMLKAGNCYFELFEYTAPPPRSAAPLRPCDLGYTHFSLDVTDIEAEHRRLVAAGMEFFDEQLGGGGEIIALYGKDPDGNIIEIQQTTPDHGFSMARLDVVRFS